MAKKEAIERNVNLDHHIPSAPLLTMGDYIKVPKSEEAQFHKKDNLEYRDFVVDLSGFTIWDRLRKPEFQRATNGWSDDKILSLLSTLRENQVIPGVILWLNTQTSHIFVLDGAHRLSVIRAWITDDWGDSEKAKEYAYLEDGEIEAAKRIRAKVLLMIGSFEESQSAAKQFRNIVDENKAPSEFLTSDIESLGRFMYNLNTALRIPIQWVIGDYETAEKSFININTGGTPLSNQEVLYLHNRRSPAARAITGIVTNATRPGVFIKYQDECEALAEELYATLLAPSDALFPRRVMDYPLCLITRQKNFDRYLFLQNILSISKHGETGEDKLSNILEADANQQNEDIVADKTRDLLKSIRQTVSHIYGNGSQSIGLHPAFYYYSNKGQFKDFLFMLFLAWASRGSTKDIIDRKVRFTLARDLFEEVWMEGKEWVFKVYGRKGAGPSRLTAKHVETLDSLINAVLTAKKDGRPGIDILDEFLVGLDPKVHADFKKQYEKEKGRPAGRFSEATKIQAEFLYVFRSGTPRCSLCGGRLHLGSHQLDHLEPRRSGGKASVANAEPKHPFCNNHRAKLEGLQRYFSDEGQLVNVPIGMLPRPTPNSSELAEQLTFGF